MEIGQTVYAYIDGKIVEGIIIATERGIASTLYTLATENGEVQARWIEPDREMWEINLRQAERDEGLL